MALVPFADNLNHSNVRVKYDYNVDRNGFFRLYPSIGAPGYAKGREVFNSYGRRDNQYLLIHYGFALPQNEWDTFEVIVSIDSLMKNGSQTHYEYQKSTRKDITKIQVCLRLLNFN